MAGGHDERARTPRARAGHLLGPVAVLKALDGIAQLASALLVMLVPGSVLTSVANMFATRDLVGDPYGHFARTISTAAERFDHDEQLGWLGLLCLIAVAKLVVSALVLTRVRGAFTAAIIVFGTLLVAEGVHAGLAASVPVLAITLVDAVVLVVLCAQLATRRRESGVRGRRPVSGAARFSPHS